MSTQILSIAEKRRREKEEMSLAFAAPELEAELREEIEAERAARASLNLRELAAEQAAAAPPPPPKPTPQQPPPPPTILPTPPENWWRRLQIRIRLCNTSSAEEPSTH